MIPVYICDDEVGIRIILERMVKNQITILNGDMGPVRAVESPDELLVLQWQDMVPAIYFLDIDFSGKMTGFTLAQQLREYDPRGFIVFITAHDDLAFETFRLRLEAMDYIVKEDSQAMAVRVRKCLESISERFLCERPGQTLIAGFVFLIRSGIFLIMRYYILRRWDSNILCGFIWMVSCWKSTAAWNTMQKNLEMDSGAATGVFL